MPFDPPQHHVDSRPDSEESERLAGTREARFDSQRRGGRKRDAPRVPQIRERREIFIQIETERLKEKLLVRLADLVAEETVETRRVETQFASINLERAIRKLHARVQQLLRIRLHRLTRRATSRRHVDLTAAKRAPLRVALRDRSEETVPRAADLFVRQKDRRATRDDR